MNCFVCEASIIGAKNEHHVVPQSRDGTDGPTVLLCPTCHTLLHNVAKKYIAGNDASHLYAHFSDRGRDRLLGLVQVIALAELEGKENPRPLLMINLDSPLYMKALKLYQKDRGFKSQAETVNAIIRAIAIRYNLLENNAVPNKRGKIALSRIESRT